LSLSHPGKDSIKRFNISFREKLLDGEVFYFLKEAYVLIAQ